MPARITVRHCWNARLLRQLDPHSPVLSTPAFASFPPSKRMSDRHWHVHWPGSQTKIVLRRRATSVKVSVDRCFGTYSSYASQWRGTEYMLRAAYYVWITPATTYACYIVGFCILSATALPYCRSARAEIGQADLLRSSGAAALLQHTPYS
jgi:hypothetical protein